MPKFISKLSPGWRCFELTLASLLLVTSISDAEAKPTITKDLKYKSQDNISLLSTNSNTLLKGKLPEKDGIYLYGQSPEPDQIGQEYIVFEVRQGKVTGAFFLPSSEFSCFQGSLADGKLDLIIANDSDSSPYSDSIADAQNSPQVATAGNTLLRDEQMSSSYSVALQNYHKISSLSNNDKRILTTCKNNYQ